MNQNITQNKNYSSGKAARAALQASDAVLFDLDGTLVDSMWMWKEIDIEYLGRFGLSCPPDLQKIIEGMSFSETAFSYPGFHRCDQSRLDPDEHRKIPE